MLADTAFVLLHDDLPLIVPASFVYEPLISTAVSAYNVCDVPDKQNPDEI